MVQNEENVAPEDKFAVQRKDAIPKVYLHPLIGKGYYTFRTQKEVREDILVRAIHAKILEYKDDEEFPKSWYISDFCCSGVLGSLPSDQKTVLTKEQYETLRGKVRPFYKLRWHDNSVGLGAFFEIARTFLFYLLKIGRKPFHRDLDLKCKFINTRFIILEDALIRKIISGESFHDVMKKSEYIMRHYVDFSVRK